MNFNFLETVLNFVNKMETNKNGYCLYGKGFDTTRVMHLNCRDWIIQHH